MSPLKRFLAVTTCIVAGLQAAPQPGVSIHKLNNGMDVLLIENRALPMVGVNVIIKTGSAYETYVTSGMSHMLEHLLFNGTTTRTQRELYDDTDLIGGYNNAHTDDYYTDFMMVMPAENTVAGMEIQADMLFNSTLPEDKFEKEKGIVLEEIAQSLSKPATQMGYNLAAELYRGHALSLPTLGTYATIEHMSRDAVNDYYKSTYLPNNMILCAIGNFDSETMLYQVTRIYGAAAPGSVYRPNDSILKTGFTRGVTSTLQPGTWLDRYYGGELNTLHQIYSLPLDLSGEYLSLLQKGLSEKTADLKKTLDEQFSGVVESLEFEMYTSPVANYAVYKLSLNPSKDSRAINAALYDLVKKPKIKFPRSSLASIATRERTDFLQNVEKPHMFGIYNSYGFAVKGIDGVLSMPSKASLAATAKALKKFRFREQPAVIFHHAGELESAEKGGEIATRLIQPPTDGMGVIARQNSASELLAIHYLFKYKAAFEAKYGKDAAKVLHACFGQRMKSEEREAESQKYGFKYTVNDNPWIPMDNIYLHPDFGYIRVEGLANDVTGAIAFLNREMNGFIPSPEEFEKAKEQFSRGMMHAGKDKAKDLFDALRDSVLYGPPQDTPEKALTYESLVAFSREYFSPENRIVSVVSPLAPETVGKLLLAGQEDSTPTQLSLTEKDYISPTKPVSVSVSGGGERSYLYWGFVKDIAPEDEAAVKALSLLLSDKIIFDVREEQGMAYRMSATSSVRNGKGVFYITLGTRPQNVDVLMPQFPELMSAATLGELTERDVQRAINMYLGRMMFRRLSSINQAYYLGTSLFFEGDMNADQSQLDNLKAVSLEDVRRVADKYLVADNPVSIVVR